MRKRYAPRFEGRKVQEGRRTEGKRRVTKNERHALLLLGILATAGAGLMKVINSEQERTESRAEQLDTGGPQAETGDPFAATRRLIHTVDGMLPEGDQDLKNRINPEFVQAVEEGVIDRFWDGQSDYRDFIEAHHPEGSLELYDEICQGVLDHTEIESTGSSFSVTMEFEYEGEEMGYDAVFVAQTYEEIEGWYAEERATYIAGMLKGKSEQQLINDWGSIESFKNVLAASFPAYDNVDADAVFLVRYDHQSGGPNRVHLLGTKPPPAKEELGIYSQEDDISHYIAPNLYSECMIAYDTVQAKRGVK